MVRPNDPQEPRPRHLRLVPLLSPVAQPLPAVVPLLRPDQLVAPAQDALLTAIARQARLGDGKARDLLWRSFAPRMEPAIIRCGRMTYQPEWVRRDGRPWELDDLRQEAWLVFSDVIVDWNGKGSFVRYATAYFPWRLRNAIRRLGPPRLRAPHAAAAGLAAEFGPLLDAEVESLMTAIMRALSPADASVLELRMAEGLSLTGIARRLGITRRTVNRRWARIRRVARGMLTSPAPPTDRG
jgi:RNA polymerase sigma factor (sigma-70 family)